ncbi:MAG: hypothetical protein QOF44_4277, partial [Streptomyces sp.]|nr:hypothetical protein [Streptomyces sp.]
MAYEPVVGDADDAGGPASRPAREWAALRPGDRVKAAAGLMLAWVGVLWLVEALDVLSGHALD